MSKDRRSHNVADGKGKENLIKNILEHKYSCVIYGNRLFSLPLWSRNNKIAHGVVSCDNKDSMIKKKYFLKGNNKDILLRESVLGNTSSFPSFPSIDF